MPKTRRPGTHDTALIALADCGPTTATDFAAWEATAEDAILRYAAPGQEFTTYDAVRALDVPEPPNKNHWGLLVSRLHRDGLLSHVGYEPSHRPASGGSAVSRWRITHPSAAPVESPVS